MSVIILDQVFKYIESIKTLSASRVSGNPICVKATACLFSVINDVINAGSLGVESTRFTLFDFTSSNSSFVNPKLYARSMYVCAFGPDDPFDETMVSLFVESVRIFVETGLFCTTYLLSGFCLGFSNGVKYEFISSINFGLWREFLSGYIFFCSKIVSLKSYIAFTVFTPIASSSVTYNFLIFSTTGKTHCNFVSKF